MAERTPMQQQWFEIKQQHPEDIVLFRLGDFYEAFEQDAKILHKVLGLTLTGRGQGEKKIEMAGIPHHSLDNYLTDIIKAGYKVVMVDQLSEPEPGKLVERGVTKIHTAGTLMEDGAISDDKNNYLAAIVGKPNQQRFGVAFADLSTGYLQVFQTSSKHTLKQELARIRPTEVVVAQGSMIQQHISQLISGWEPTITVRPSAEFEYEECYARCLKQFDTKNLKGYGIDDAEVTICALGATLYYFDDTQRVDLAHLTKVRKYNFSDYMQLDWQTIRNLELIYPMMGDNSRATVFYMLNECNTSMGKRKLREWLLRPYRVAEPLQDRWGSVGYIKSTPVNMEELRVELAEVSDIERIVGKIGTSNANARDLQALKFSLEQVAPVIEILSGLEDLPRRLQYLLAELSENESSQTIQELISINIKQDPPVEITEGKIIADGVNPEIDRLRELASGGKEQLASIQSREQEDTGIGSLKVGFNKVFGYYIEVTKTHSDKVPDSYNRKQTLTNSERYITPELKELEEQILTAQEQLKEIEYQEFLEIRSQVAEHSENILLLADAIAELDVFVNLAFIAREYDLCEPQLSEQDELVIREGRHLVVERLQDQFTPNDIDFSEGNNLKILTGPNMSGKSTFIRQVALITLLAQVGSFVPAKEFRFSLLDNIFTRVGASDNLSSGESTFMVEMNETANILNNATDRSLIIFDEVGRGTSTYDGVAIAWSIAEHVMNEIGAKTLFATHYHELITLADESDAAENLHVEVTEHDDDILFKHKISPGATSKSYGVHVAEMAGVPQLVVERAHNILASFEENQQMAENKPSQSPTDLDQAATRNGNGKKKAKAGKKRKTPSPRRPKKIHPEQMGLL